MNVDPIDRIFKKKSIYLLFKITRVSKPCQNESFNVDIDLKKNQINDYRLWNYLTDTV